MTATQVRTSDQSTTKPLLLGYAFEVLPTKSEVRDISLTAIQLTILDISGVPVKVDTLKLDVIHSWDHLHIARITRIPYSESPGADICTNSICRLRAIIASRLRKMIDTAKGQAGKAKTWIKNGCSGWKPAQAGAEQAHEKPHRHGRHRHGSHRHHGHGRLHRFFRQAVHFFIALALFGVPGVLFTYALGMLIYMGVARCYSRRSRREALGRDREIALEDGEKGALVENEELPPQYEDLQVVLVEEKQ